MGERIPATRLNLIQLRRRAERAQAGLGLMKDKREALMRAFLAHLSERVQYHDLMEARCGEAVGPLAGALARHGAAGLDGLGWAAARPLALDVTTEKVWGMDIATFQKPPVARSWRERGFAPVTAGREVNEAADRFEELVELIVETAATEVRIKRLGAEIRKTSRRINALEGRLIPRMRATARRIRDVLEEGERDEHQRLRCLKRLRAGRGR